MPGTDPNLAAAARNLEPPDPLIGIELGGFRVTRLIAAGGMGLVYEAFHEAIGRRAAVKVLKPEIAANADWTRRFLVEARALGSMKHKNLIEILNFGKTPDGREFLMMEFLDGESLDQAIHQRAPFTPAVALGIVDQMLNGLAEAHKKGVVHRDLKPSNVQLIREHNGETLVKVLDFGLARQEPVSLVDGSVTVPSGAATGASLLAGTPQYIAPEQAQGKKAEGTADLYSVGIILFEMLSGRLPFESESVTTLLMMHLADPPPDLSTLVDNLPDGVQALVESMLEKDPARRPASADEARVGVQRILKQLSRDATSVRGRISSEMLAPATLKFDKPIVAPAKSMPMRLMIALLCALAAVTAGVVFVFWSAPPPVTEAAIVLAPVVNPIAKVDLTPAEVPSPQKPVEPPAPAETELQPLAPRVKVAKPPVRPAPPPPTCVPSEKWKERLTKDVTDFGDRISNNVPLYEIWDREARPLTTLIMNASTVEECQIAQARFVKLRRTLGFVEPKDR